MRPEPTNDDDPGAAEADLYEQQRDVIDDGETGTAVSGGTDDPTPDEVDPADAQEQQQVVDYDEDDYR